MIDEMNIYCVFIAMADDDYELVYDIEHRFASLPAVDLLVALKDEAEATYVALYGEAPEDKIISVRYLDAVERLSTPDALFQRRQ